MRIRFERSGGFAGLVQAVTVDTASLPEGEARALEELVQGARLAELPTARPAPARGADRLCYRLTVEAEGRRQEIEVCEPDVPDRLQPLLRQLAKMARAARG